MTRKCSYCSHHGHNSRTCTNRGVKIFGVRLIDGSIRKSASMGNLSHCNSNNHVNGLAGGIHDTPDHAAGGGGGYVSEDFVAGSFSSSDRGRKKGVAWTEEEHRMFLLGLHKLGKGDWRGISKNYVISRTPTQVASHAQKYFIRQTNVSRRKRRSSLFDIVPDEVGDSSVPKPEKQSSNIVPIPVSSPPTLNNEKGGEEEEVVVQSMDYTNANQGEPSYYPFLFPTFVPTIIPYPVPVWTTYGPEPAYQETHQVVKPLAAKQPINVNELVEMSRLRIAESSGEGEQLLSLTLMDGSTRQSAFHPNSNSGKSNVGSGSNAIHAV